MIRKAQSRPLCVAQVLPALDQGGVERGTLETAGALVERGYRALVVSAGGGMVDALEALGAVHVRLPLGVKSPLTLRFVRRLKKLVESEGVDVLHARSRLPAWIAYLAWRGLPVERRPRFVTTVHGLYSVNVYSAVMTKGERVIAVSEAARDYVLRNYPAVEPGRIQVIHRGVDDSLFHPGYAPPEAWRTRFKSEFCLSDDRFIVTLAGRLSRIKGHQDFIELVAALKQRGVPVHGLAVGGGPPGRDYAETLAQTVKRRALPLTFTGGRDDLRDIFAVSGAVVSLSSKPESFGRTVNEALALGVPVVGYDHGGVGEILRTMYPRGAVPVNDVGAAADALERIYREGPQAIRANAFPLSRTLEATIRLYETLTGGGAPGAGGTTDF